MAVLAASLLAGIPARSEAQATAEARRELDSLLPQLAAANARLTDIEQARRRSAGAMLVQRGHLTVMADSAIAPLIGDAAAVATASLDRVFGADAQRAAAQSIVARVQSVARNGDTSRVIRVRRTESLERERALGDLRLAASEERVVALDTPERTHADLVKAFEALGAAPLHSSLDDELRFWFRSALPATSETSSEIEDIYVDLATSSTGISRGCLAGDVGRCRQALGLSPIADPVLDAYTASQRRSLVATNAPRLRLPANASEYDRCVRGDDDAACINRLRELPEDLLTRGLSSTAARRSFARWALAKGGAGAYSRLRSGSHLSVVERFAATAGVPTDSLVASWQQHVTSGRPAQSSLPPISAFATLLWIGVCGALSLRSTKWR